jgi:hypothetical protein
MIPLARQNLFKRPDLKLKMLKGLGGLWIGIRAELRIEGMARG